MTNEEILKQAKEKIETAKSALIRNEARKEQAEKELAQIKNEMATLGVTPENIVEVIAKLEQEIEVETKELQAALQKIEEGLN